MSKIWDIHGGIHPPENKIQSLQRAIMPVPLPDMLVLPLSQHLGAAALPLVKPGDMVLKGQAIAAPNGLISAAVHAPTSGTIVAIEERPVPHPSGAAGRCIVLRPDGEERWLERHPQPDYQTLSPVDLLAIVRDAGVTGLGGAGFPTAVKLQPRQPIDTLIINATECEPYITADDILIRERAREIITGIEILAHILGNPQRVLIGIEDNKPEAYDALRALLNGSHIELIEFPTKYPSGGEKQLIQILTGKEVPSGRLPAELGIVCQNVGTTYAIYRAVCAGEPLISRITTVTGNSCKKPGNYEVLLGTPVADLLALAEFDEFLCQRLIMGGPMMGYTLSDVSVPVIKSTNCLLAADAVESPANSIAQACIRCGHCAEVCPANLLPQQLYWHAKARDYDKLAAHHLTDCIECGACSYVCPSEIPLVQYYRAAKGEIRAIDKEKKIADRARQRFEFHQQRIDKAEQEKAARREARRQAAAAAKLAGADDASAGKVAELDVVQAALARVNATKASPEAELKRLQRAAAAAENRVTGALEKLAQCAVDDARHSSLQAALEQARLRLSEALNNQQRHIDASQTGAGGAAQTGIAQDGISQNGISQNSADHTINATDAVALDRAAQAIQRAQQRSAQQAEMSTQEKLQSQCDSLRKRLDKARDRLKQAQSGDQQQPDQPVDALANAVTTLASKVAEAEARLAASLAEQE